MMKNLFYIALSLLLISATACKKDTAAGEVDLGYLNIEKSNVRFDYLGGTGEIVAATSSAVTAVLGEETGAAWCELSTARNIVTVNVSENTGKQSRHTWVVVSADGRNIKVPVSQTPKPGGSR